MEEAENPNKSKQKLNNKSGYEKDYSNFNYLHAYGSAYESTVD